MNKREIIDALAPSVKPEILEAIRVIFDREEMLSKAASMFNSALAQTRLKSQETPDPEFLRLDPIAHVSNIRSRAEIENKMDCMRSNPKYMSEIND